jgi:DNA primase large subunit
MGSLNNAKGTKNAIIDDLARTRYVQFSKSKAIKEVEGSIASGIASNDIGKSGNTSRFNQLLSELLEYKAYWAVAAAYTAEYNKREKDSKDVTAAIEKGDVAALKALRSKVNVAELKTNIEEAIKSIEEAKKAEEEKQKAAEAARKAEEERLAAINKAAEELANATTPEQKAAAQAKLDALRLGSGSSEGGIPKMVIYGGIGLVVAIGAYLMFRKKA